MVDKGTQTLAEVNVQERKECSRDMRVKCLKVRILLTDPDATDSSSDEECKMNFTRKKLNKGDTRLLTEVVLNFPVSKRDENAKPLRTSPKRKSFSQYKGVRWRQSGNWAAEIRDPIKGGRLWLGTFKSELEAAQAYQKKKLEFDSLKLSENHDGASTHRTAPISQPQPCASEETNVIGSKGSPSSVLRTGNAPVADDVRSRAPMKGRAPSVSAKPADDMVKSRAPTQGKTQSVSRKPVDDVTKSRMPSGSVKLVNDAVKSREPMEPTVPSVSAEPMDDVIKSGEPIKCLAQDHKAGATAAAPLSTKNNFDFEFDVLRLDDLPFCCLDDIEVPDDFDLGDFGGEEDLADFGDYDVFGDFGSEEDFALLDPLKVGLV